VTGTVCRTLADPALHRQRDAFTLVCLYTAYLITVHDDEARAAFLLLAGAEKMHLNALSKGYKMVQGNVHKYRQYSAANSSKRSGTGRYSGHYEEDEEEDFEVGNYDSTDSTTNSSGGRKALFSTRHDGSKYSENSERFSRDGTSKHYNGISRSNSNNKYRNGAASRRNDNSSGSNSNSRGGGGSGGSSRYKNSDYDDTNRFARHDNKYKY